MTRLDDWLALLEKRHAKPIDLGLERCGEVYRRLGSPRPGQQVFTVAGTNGKGSTVAYLEALAGAVGIPHGSYTSPHISHFNERIRIMGQPVPDTAIVSAFERVEQCRGGVSLSYFEFTTLAGLLLLNEAGLHCAILEVGLGGRLDTVNLVDADCVIITPIGLDHQEFLGPDIDSIAVEKAGVMRPGIPVVCTQREPPAPVFHTAERLNSSLHLRGRDFELVADIGSESPPERWLFSLQGRSVQVRRSSMPGQHQLDNLAAALAGFLLLNPAAYERADAIGEAIARSRVPGRLQYVHRSPDIILDVGHNEAAARVVAAYLAGNGGPRISCILGMLADKPVEAVAATLEKLCRRWLCVGTGGDRGQNGEVLAKRVLDSSPDARVESFDIFESAIGAALADAGREDTILVFGSFYVVADALAWWRRTGAAKLDRYC